MKSNCLQFIHAGFVTGTMLVFSACANSTPASEADLFSVGNWSRYQQEVDETQNQVDNEYEQIDQMADRISERRRVLEKLEREEGLLKTSLSSIDNDIETRRLQLENAERDARIQIDDYQIVKEAIDLVQAEIKCYLALDSYTQAEAARADIVFSAAEKLSGPALFEDPAISLNVSSTLAQMERCQDVLD